MYQYVLTKMLAHEPTYIIMALCNHFFCASFLFAIRGLRWSHVFWRGVRWSSWKFEASEVDLEVRTQDFVFKPSFHRMSADVDLIETSRGSFPVVSKPISARKFSLESS